MAWKFLVAAILTSLCGCDVQPSRSQYGDADDFLTQIDVKQIAEKAVKQCLKHPLNASFGWGGGAVKAANGTWVCNGSVTAPNDFGANLTKDWKVAAVLTDRKEKQWEVLLVVYDGSVAYANPKADEIKADEPRGAVDRNEPAKPPDAIVVSPDEPPLVPEPIPIENPKRRIWTSADGKFSVDAEFASYGGGTLKLRKISDGAEISVPIDRLSEDDRAWLKEYRHGK